MKTIVEFENVTKQYVMGENIVHALRGVSFTIKQGDMTAIVGESGSGKSSIMNIIGLLDRQTTGKYALNEKLVSSLSETELARIRNRHIGFIFQQYFLLPRMTALQNVALPLQYRQTPRSEIKKRSMAMLERMGVGQFHHHRPSQMSGGQQQRVAISRALVGEPEIILADEPTGALDSQTSQEVMDLFLELNKEGYTIVMVTHDPHVAAQCQNEIRMKDGEIVDV